jgi:hypothetical protein
LKLSRFVSGVGVEATVAGVEVVSAGAVEAGIDSVATGDSSAVGEALAAGDAVGGAVSVATIGGEPFVKNRPAAIAIAIAAITLAATIRRARIRSAARNRERRCSGNK